MNKLLLVGFMSFTASNFFSQASGAQYNRNGEGFESVSYVESQGWVTIFKNKDGSYTEVRCNGGKLILGFESQEELASKFNALKKADADNK